MNIDKIIYEIADVDIGAISVKFTYKDKVDTNIAEGSSLIHLHSGIELHFVYSGSVELVSDGKKMVVNAGSICLIPANLNHQFLQGGYQSEIYNMLIDIKNSDSACDDYEETKCYKKLFSQIKDIVVIENCDKAIRYTKDLLDVISEKDDIHNYIKESLLRLIFLSVADCAFSFNGLNGNGQKNDNMEKHIKSLDIMIENYIMDNFLNNITIADVANFIGYSKTHIARKIKKNYDMSFTDLILKLKMSHAKSLLVTTDMRMLDIAKSIGYNSYNGFGMAFKKRYGKTPEQIREQGNLI